MSERNPHTSHAAQRAPASQAAQSDQSAEKGALGVRTPERASQGRTDARAVLDAAISEHDFQQRILDCSWRCGWECSYHTHDSRRSEPGYPDLTLVSTARRRCIFVEVKSERGRVRPEQRRWHAALRAAGQEVFVWRPSDWESVERTLKGE